jgi:hypothetical protein
MECSLDLSGVVVGLWWLVVVLTWLDWIGLDRAWTLMLGRMDGWMVGRLTGLDLRGGLDPHDGGWNFMVA